MRKRGPPSHPAPPHTHSHPLCAPAHPPHTHTGASQWPGANFVLFPSGDKIFLKFGDRRRLASELKIGDVVERHLEGGWRGLWCVCLWGGGSVRHLERERGSESSPTFTPSTPTPSHPAYRRRHRSVQPPALVAPHVHHGPPRAHHALAHPALQRVSGGRGGGCLRVFVRARHALLPLACLPALTHAPHPLPLTLPPPPPSPQVCLRALQRRL